MHIVRQAIVTKYIGATDTKPARIRVLCEAKTRIYSWDDARNIEGNHRWAAQALALELNWTGKWYQGSLPQTENWRGAQVFVNVDGKYESDTKPAFEIKL